MSKTINAIRGLLNLPDLHKFYAEAKLDDGRLVVTEADSMEVGVEIRVMTDEGTAEDLADGNYVLEDGTALVVAEGRIAQLGEDEPEAEAPAEEAAPAEEQLAAKEEEDYSKLRKELGRLGLNERQQIDVMRAVLDALNPGTEEEVAAAEEEIEEMSSIREFASEVQAAFDHVLARLSALEDAPADAGVQHTPARARAQEQVNFSALSPRERAHAIIRNSIHN